MNINQQAEIEELFRRINKSIQKNNTSKINDEDLNKVRAYVVQSKYSHPALSIQSAHSPNSLTVSLIITTIRLTTIAGSEAALERAGGARHGREVHELEGGHHPAGLGAGAAEE